MKKITFVSILSFLFLLLASISEYLLRYIAFEDQWIPLVFGVIILAVSGIFGVIFKRFTVVNVICYIANFIALGLCIRCWYIYKGYNNELWVMALVSLACLLYILIFYLLLYIPKIEKHFNIYIWVFIGATLLIYIPVMIFSKTTYVSTFGYYAIVEVAFIFAMCKHQSSFKNVFRDIVLSTYSIFLVAILIALIMASGDGIDGFDIGGDMDLEIASPKNKKLDNNDFIENSDLFK